MATCQKKILVDVDTGVDDAQALMMVLASSHVEVLGITCVAGNTGIDNVLTNTLTTLRVMNKLQVPVYRGCQKPLVYEQDDDASFHHGKNGLGGFQDEHPPDMKLLKKQHAASAIVDIVNAHPGEITLVALAPLTNIAVALQLDPTLGSKLKEVVIMGGNLLACGNYGLVAEFNFGFDPEAANVTLSRIGCPVTLVPYETCKNEMQLPWDWYDQLVSMDSSRGKFHRDIDQQPTQRKRIKLKLPKYYSCDPAAMAIVIDAEVMTSYREVYSTVELRGEHSRGCLIIDEHEKLGRKPNVKIATSLNTQKIKVLFENMVK